MAESVQTSNTLKDRLEANPVLYLLGTSVAFATIVAGVMTYWSSQRIASAEERCNNQVTTLQTELTSIKRGVGDNKLLDIRTFLYPKGASPPSGLNPNSKYVANEDFYAMMDVSNFEHQKLTEKQFIEWGTEEEFSLPIAKTMGNFPVHVWRNSVGLLRVESKNLVVLGPVISLERIPLDRIVRSAIQALPEEVERQKKLKLLPAEIEISAEGLERYFRGDEAARVFSSWLDMQLAVTNNVPESTSSLVEVRKVGNVVYAQLLRTVRDPEVNGKRVGVYFIRYELIVITDREYLTTIQVTVPSADPAPRGTVYSKIQEWFSGLAIPVE
jgi:hypothetical protein